MILKSLAGVVCVILVAIIGGAYYLVIDGDLPKQSDFELDLVQYSNLADAPISERPHSIEVEIIARNEVPKFGTHAGLDRSPVTMARAVFRLRSDWGDTLIDVGMDELIARKFNPGDVFDAEASARVYSAIGKATRIAVTHEHPDHLGLLGRYEDLERVRPALRLTQAQIDGIPQYTDGYSLPEELLSLKPVSVEDGPSVIAPGVVMIPAPGHTPGTVLFYVKMTDNTEVMFLGDIVWNMSNIEKSRGRPRLVQQYLMPMPEDRNAVYQQVSALVELNSSNPEVTLIPSHDEGQINTLIEQGILFSGFEYDG